MQSMFKSINEDFARRGINVEKTKASLGTMFSLLAAFEGWIVRSFHARDAKHKEFQTRIAELEQKLSALPRYEGVFENGHAYTRGAMTTHDGSVWFCKNEMTTDVPGTSPAWTLAVKRGRDFRPGSNERRSTSC